MTTNRIRTILALLVGALALAGGAAAQGHVHQEVETAAGGAMAYADETTAHGDAAAAHEGASAAAEGGLYDEGNYGDLDAAAGAEESSAALDADGSMAEPQDAAKGGFWAWLSLHVGAMLASVADLVGVDLAPDAGADAYVSGEGVDIDTAIDVPCTGVAGEIPCGETTFDDSPLGDVDGATWSVGAAPVG